MYWVVEKPQESCMFNFPAIKVAFDLCSAMTFHTYLGGFVNDPAIAKCINIATTLPASTWKPLIKAKPVIKKKAENIHYQTKDGWIVGGKDAAHFESNTCEERTPVRSLQCFSNRAHSIPDR